MNNKQILDNAPEGATHVDDEGDYWLMNPENSTETFMDGEWLYCNPQEPLRSLADIKRIAELEAQTQWISVEDRLPEDDSLVVAAYLYGFACDPDAAVCKFYNGNFQLNTDGLEASNYDGGATITMDFKVTHWMPLPTPPKEQGE